MLKYELSHIKKKKKKDCLLFEGVKACETADREVVFTPAPRAAFLSCS